MAAQLDAATQLYRSARVDNAPHVAERLTRNVLVLVDRVPEPLASELAALARRYVDGYACEPDESGGLAEEDE